MNLTMMLPAVLYRRVMTLCSRKVKNPLAYRVYSARMATIFVRLDLLPNWQQSGGRHLSLPVRPNNGIATLKETRARMHIRRYNRQKKLMRFFSTPSKIADAVSAVHAQFDAGMIEPHDPVNLWAAVMQACHYSIKQGRAMTIVQSARMWWFVQLGGDNSCVVRISTARKVGSRHFLTRVMQFLNYARYFLTMAKGLRRRWEKAIATLEPGVATTNEESNGGDSPRGQKRHRQSSTGKAS
jgi:hypothetical protein